MFNFNHVTISAKDLEETLIFYKKFGFKLKKEFHNEQTDIVWLELGFVVLEIFYYKDNMPLPEHSKSLDVDLRTIGNKHFGLGVKDIQKAKEFVVKNNLAKDEIKIVKGRLGSNYFFITDPNGILMEIIEEE